MNQKVSTRETRWEVAGQLLEIDWQVAGSRREVTGKDAGESVETLAFKCLATFNKKYDWVLFEDQ